MPALYDHRDQGGCCSATQVESSFRTAQGLPIQPPQTTICTPRVKPPQLRIDHGTAVAEPPQVDYPCAQKPKGFYLDPVFEGDLSGPCYELTLKEELAACALLRLGALSQAGSARCRSAAKLFAVFSARGGSGKSTFSALAALALAGRGLRVALIDCDLQFGDLGQLMPAQDEALRRYEICAEAPLSFLQSAEPGQVLLFSNQAGPEWFDRGLERLPQLVADLRSRVDLILLNCGSYWNDLQARLAQNADRLFFMVDQRATSVRSSRDLLGLLRKLQVPEAKMAFVLNRCGKGQNLSELDVSMALGGLPVAPLVEGGRIVEELMALGRADRVLSEAPSLAASLSELLARLVPELNEDTGSWQNMPGSGPLHAPQPSQADETACIPAVPPQPVRANGHDQSGALPRRRRLLRPPRRQRRRLFQLERVQD
ncbi:MAG: P-loop NTPase [Coriobacteriales bacterium]|jgi:MinD-like ATPase involved in chromosome partitioning or flagellar assembly|nr:P-loop NTPase [Coriobacteriales bacterium]